MAHGFDDETLPPPQEVVGADTARDSGPLIGGPVPSAGERERDDRPKPLAGAFRRGEELDHFVVLSELGAGAMGVVLEALDPDLDRRVAIKLMRARPGSTDAAQVRMLREAQSMARVTHPNVVAVHQVGTVRGQVYIAMEFIDGRSLKQWLAQGEHTVAEILATFDAAGQGLHAAHRVDLVHRDFKPDNVLVSSDGRVVVTDFGLVAAQAADTMAEVSDAFGTSSGGGALSLDLTRTGTVLGTPAYMAPEQHHDHDVDARADQFSFCVALWEALYGSRPFAGGTLPELVANLVSGRRPSPPSRTVDGERVPRRVRRAIERGLALAPDERWPDMPALLGALRPRRRGRQLLGVGLIAAAVSGAAVAAAIWTADDPAAGKCLEAGRTAAEDWSDARRSELVAAFVSTGRPFAQDSAAEVAGAIDAWVRAWTTEYEGACEATYGSGEQSQVGLELRTACLRQELGETLAVADLLTTELDDVALVKAKTAVDGLPAPARCRDVATLVRRAERVDPRVVGEVQSIKEAARVPIASGKVGHVRRAAERIEPLVERARKTGDAALQAELLRSLGEYRMKLGQYPEAEALLKESLGFAADAGLIEVEIEAWSHLVHSVAGQAQLDRAEGLLGAAEVAVRKTDDPKRRAQFLHTLAGLRHGQGKLQEAEQAVREAIGALDGAGMNPSPEAGVYLNSLAAIVSDQGRSPEAIAAYRQAIDVLEAELGFGHPNVAAPLSNLGIQVQLQGDYDEARRLYERTLTIWTRAYGEKHQLVAVAHENLGVVDQYQGQLEAARRQHEHALTIRTAAFGAEHPQVASSHNNIGMVAFALGQYEVAAEHWGRARELWVSTLGDKHPSIVDVEFNLASLWVATGDHERARQAFERVVEIIDAAGLEATHPRRAASLVGIANALRLQDRCEDAQPYLADANKALQAGIGLDNVDGAHLLSCEGACALVMGREQEAAEIFEHSIRIRTEQVSEPEMLARDRFDLARALWSLGRRTEALRHAERAAEGLRPLGPPHAAFGADIQAWIADHE